MVSKDRLTVLFTRYMNATGSLDDTSEFMFLIKDDRYTLVFNEIMDEYLKSNPPAVGLEEHQKTKILNAIFESKKDNSITALKLNSFKIFQFWKVLIPAAVIFITLSIGIYFTSKQNAPLEYVKYSGEIPPGGNKATLILANGQTISLTDAARGKVAVQAGNIIRKTADGRLIYEQADNENSNQSYQKDLISYNTISTPSGGTFQVVLPDGTKVWLNSTSSLKYPVSFAKLKERRVQLIGEAYFEVSKIKKLTEDIPFVVSSNQQEVKVLGTHFNISAYQTDQSVTTTLLEGSVSVSRSSVFKQLLKPGEQALVNQNVSVTKVDTTTAVAWKNGLFKFEKADIQTVMNQFSRWYNVDVEYQGKVPDHEFTGEIYRNMSASKALKILTLAKINFKVVAVDNAAGRKKIIILPN